MFKQYLYKLYLLTLALPLVTALIIVGWKKATIRANARICGLPYSLGFRIRFYRSAVLDLLRFAHGHYEDPITARPRDATKIQSLRANPSLFLTAHFHNWEHMGSWMNRQGIRLLSAARPMANGMSQSLLIRLRDRLGMNVVFKSIPRQALRHVRGGGCFALLWDQRVSPSNTRAPLFGRTLALDPLPRFLTQHHLLPVYFGVLLPGGRFRLIQIAAPPSSSSHGNARPDQDWDRHLGRRYHRVLERLIQAYPTYWYGLAHRRFQDEVKMGDTPEAISADHVSRETSAPSGVMVSRETNLSD